MERTLFAVVLAVGAANCKKASHEPTPSPTRSEPAAPAGHPRLPATATPDQIIADAFAHETVSLLTVTYVASDGKLDSTDGYLTLRTIWPTAARGAEADRKLGGPIAWNAPTMYAAYESWTGAGVWKRESGYGDPQLVALRPACTLAQVWKRALDQGAPADALAVLTLNAAAAGRAQHWLFTITDAPRKVVFRLEVPDDCAPIVEATP